jgi:hypothetical protein
LHPPQQEPHLKLLAPTPTGTTFNLYLPKNSVVTCAFRYDQYLVKVKAGAHILYGTIHLILSKVKAEIMAGGVNILLNMLFSPHFRCGSPFSHFEVFGGETITHA